MTISDVSATRLRNRICSRGSVTTTVEKRRSKNLFTSQCNPVIPKEKKNYKRWTTSRCEMRQRNEFTLVITSLLIYTAVICKINKFERR